MCVKSTQLIGLFQLWNAFDIFSYYLEVMIKVNSETYPVILNDVKISSYKVCAARSK